MQPSPQSNLKIFLSSLRETLGPLTLPLPLQPLGPGRPLISFSLWICLLWTFHLNEVMQNRVSVAGFFHVKCSGLCCDLACITFYLVIRQLVEIWVVFCYLSVLLLLRTLVHTYLSPRIWWSGHRYAWEWTRWVEWSLCFTLDQTGGPAGARFPFLLRGSDFSASDTRFPSFKTQPSLRVSSGISSCFRLAFP